VKNMSRGFKAKLPTTIATPATKHKSKGSDKGVSSIIEHTNPPLPATKVTEEGSTTASIINRGQSLELYHTNLVKLGEVIAGDALLKVEGNLLSAKIGLMNALRIVEKKLRDNRV